jgi:hypothetical protein
MSDSVRIRTASICLGTRVRLKKSGALGTVQFEAELVPPATSTGARLVMYPIIAIEVETDDGVIHWPLTATDVEVLP